MKRFLVFTMLIGCVLIGKSQNLELSTLYGYQFGSRIDYYGGYMKLKDGSSVGIGAGYNTGSNYIVQLNYYSNSAEVRLRDVVYSPTEKKILNTSIDWFSIGGTRTFGDDEAYGFFGTGFGFLITNPSDFNRDVLERDLEGSTNLYFELKGGGTYMFNDHVGFRAQALLQCPIDYAGVYFGYGSGGPSSGVSVTSTVILFSLQGGLVFTLPQ